MSLLHADGRYNMAAIMSLANANKALRREIYQEGFGRGDVRRAFTDAWNRAKAERTQFNVRTGRVAPLTPLEALELSTDARC